MKKHLFSRGAALLLILSLLASLALAAGPQKLLSAEPQYPTPEHDGFQLNPNAEPVRAEKVSARLDPNSFGFYAFYTPDGKPLDTELTSDDSNIAVVDSFEGTDEHLIYTISGKSVGETTLRCTKDGTVYTQTVEVVLPDPGFFTEQTYEERAFCPEIRYDRNLGTTVYLMSRDGFSKAEAEAMTVEPQNGLQVSCEPVLRAENRYDLKLLLPADQELSAQGAGFWVKQGQQWLSWGNVLDAYEAAEQELNGTWAELNEIIVGFSNGAHGDQFELIQPELRDNREGAYSARETYSPHCGVYVAAGKRVADGEDGFYFQELPESDVTIQINRIWLDEFVGDPLVFSLQADSRVTELSNPTGEINVYSRMTNDGACLVKADLTITPTGSEPQNVTISQKLTVHVMRHQTLQLTPDKDVNQALADWNVHLDARTVYEIRLAPGTYEQVLQLPETLQADTYEPRIEIWGSENGATVLPGLDFNGVVMMDLHNLTFQGTDAVRTGVFDSSNSGGHCKSIRGCLFRNYQEAAIRMDQGSTAIGEGNLFYRNKVGVLVDLDQVDGGNKAAWTGNTFLENETAIAIEDLSSWLSPYNFRIHECNFLDNTLDFDVDEEGNFYFYRNYYGTKQQGAVVSCLARKAKQGNGFLMTNPRWNLLQLDAAAYHGESQAILADYVVTAVAAEQERVLVSDWEEGTVILNDEAQNLKLDQSAFDQAGQKQVEVYNQVEQPIGTWNFK